VSARGSQSKFIDVSARGALAPDRTVSGICWSPWDVPDLSVASGRNARNAETGCVSAAGHPALVGEDVATRAAQKRRARRNPWASRIFAGTTKFSHYGRNAMIRHLAIALYALADTILVGFFLTIVHSLLKLSGVL
jgi:hypothetical protein